MLRATTAWNERQRQQKQRRQQKQMKRKAATQTTTAEEHMKKQKEDEKIRMQEESTHVDQTTQALITQLAQVRTNEWETQERAASFVQVIQR